MGKHVGRRTRNVKKERNSSVELLRLIAMLMIVAHHYVTMNPLIRHLDMEPISGRLFVFEGIYALGKIGLVIFFLISAWYLCEERNPTIRKGLKRSWILEREVLFYSLGFMLLFVVFRPDLISKKTIVYSFIPTTSGLVWWYVTAYVLFLCLSPYITVGLRAIGKKAHGALCMFMLVVWGAVSGMLPFDMFQLIGQSFIDFLYLYVLMTFYRWYLDDWSRKTAWALVGAGVVLIMGSIVVLQFLGSALHIDALRIHSHYLSSKCVMVPVIMIGFGLLLLAERRFFVNKVINYLAGTTFGIYLIHSYPPVRELLWHQWFVAERDYRMPHAVLRAAVSILIVFVGCMVVDCMRKALFSVTVDRNRGGWFDRVARFVDSRTWVRRLRAVVADEPAAAAGDIGSAALLNQADQPIPPTDVSVSRDA